MSAIHSSQLSLYAIPPHSPAQSCSQGYRSVDPPIQTLVQLGSITAHPGVNENSSGQSRIQ